MRLGQAIVLSALFLSLPAVSAPPVAGRISEVARASYETDLEYGKVLAEKVTAESFNEKMRFKLSFDSLSDKIDQSEYLKFLSKSSNYSVSFSGLNPKLPFFLNENKSPFLVKRLKEAPKGSSFFVYATLKFAWLHPVKKGKPSTESVLTTCLLIDDVLTQEEENEMDAYRAKFDKGKAKKDTPVPAASSQPDSARKDIPAPAASSQPDSAKKAVPAP